MRTKIIIKGYPALRFTINKTKLFAKRAIPWTYTNKCNIIVALRNELLLLRLVKFTIGKFTNEFSPVGPCFQSYSWNMEVGYFYNELISCCVENIFLSSWNI